MSTTATLLSWQPDGLTPAQMAAVSYLARYSGPTHALYAYQLRRWFGWCESNGLDPADRGAARPRRAVHPWLGRVRTTGLFDRHDDARRPRVLPLRAHRRPDRSRPGRVRPATQGPRRRDPHPRLGPPQAHPVPPSRADSKL